MHGARHKTLASWRGIAIAFIGGVLLLVTGPSVFAVLNAQTSNTKPSAGFSTSIDNLAPNDSVNRYIDLTNSGSIDSRGLTLAIASTGTASLITDGSDRITTRALRVTVTSCVAEWEQEKGICSGKEGAVTQIKSAPLSDFAKPQAFADSILAAAGLHLQIQTELPDQVEMTTNGRLPENTVQKGSVDLTYTFAETQRTGLSTNS